MLVCVRARVCFVYRILYIWSTEQGGAETYQQGTYFLFFECGGYFLELGYFFRVGKLFFQE